MASISASLATSSSKIAETPLVVKDRRGLRCKSSAGKRISSTRRLTATCSVIQRAEYIWDDGLEGTKGLLFNSLRSKTKCLTTVKEAGSTDFPDWSFDGSSTGQAEGNDSDCILKPVFSCPDPIRGAPHVLVVCEVLKRDSTPHPTNTRALLREMCTPEVLALNPLYGMEQEYTMLGDDSRPFGWPEGGGYPAPQGPFYCGVGSQAVYGRPLAEAHMDACCKANLKISGINAEVMPGQWEFQIGPAGPLEVGDHITVARWLLNRLGEDFGITITLDPKPVKGDWNGTGMHTNFSTSDTMNSGSGMEAIDTYVERLSKVHNEHIAAYGLGNEQRLTGKHETASIDTFLSGVANRGASIRIPLPVELAGCGYLEDRRPSANADPYTVARMLLSTCVAQKTVAAA